MKIYGITFLTILLGTVCNAAELKEDFEGYKVDKSINKQNSWGERAYGNHPSCKVTVGKDPLNTTRILSPVGGGDRHVFKHFPKKKFQEIIAGKVIVLDFSFKSGAQVELAVAGRYASGKGLLIKCGKRLSLRFDKKLYTGILKFENRRWNDVRVIIDKSEQDARVTIACKKKGSAKYIADPEINNLKLPLTPAITKYWNGLNVRIDGGCALDDIVISSFKSMKKIPGKMDKGKITTSFSPILDYITLPRKAVSLCGKWSYYVAKDGKLPETSSSWQTLIVPDDHSGIVNSAGRGSVFFRKEIHLSNIEKNKQYYLCFERVTDICEIFINGHKAGTHTEGHFPFKINISPFVRSGSNTLTVKVLGPKATNAYRNRPQGWSWFLGKFAGIPYPVHLETTGNISIQDIFIKPHVDKSSSLTTIVSVQNLSSENKEIQLRASSGKEFTCVSRKTSIPAGKTVTITLNKQWPAPRLWWPHDPNLYFLKVEIIANGKIIDACKQRFGFRELRVAGDVILLNNRKLLHRRSSIIPYWSRSNKQAILEMFNILKKRGFNGSRLHGGSNLRIIRTADEFGWLIAPESAINEPRGHQVTKEYWPAAREHLKAMIKTFRNNPSVIYWCLSNEFASFYMKGSDEEKAQVDAKMLEFGKMTEQLDPTRTWTCSGDGELGGQGHQGPAPTLSFHYAWQPFKTHNMIPNTAYWLSEGKKSWQGIVWAKRKPVMLSEDLYPPYALKPPHGMAQWAGEKAFDPEKGLAAAWYEAYNMLCDGYYYAPVSCWNPWGTGESVPGNPLYAYGQLMPDYHIAIKELNVSFFSGEKSQRKIFIYNQLFKDLDCSLNADLLENDRKITSCKRNFTLNGGSMLTLNLPLQFPTVSRKTKFEYQLSLISAGKKLTEKTVIFTVYPKDQSFQIPPRTVIVGSQINITGITKAYKSLTDALKSRPANLIIAGYSPLSSQEGQILNKAVNDGLNVLWIEVPVKGWKPCKIYPNGIAALSFIRAPEDPCLAGIDNNDLKLWRPQSLSTLNAMFKPSGGACDILLDCLYGLSGVSLMRKYSGKGSWLLCQLPIVTSWQQEPAAKYVMSRLIEALDKPAHKDKYMLGVIAGKDGTLTKSLEQLKIPFIKSSSANVLMIDGKESLSKLAIDAVKTCCTRGGSVFIDEPGIACAGQLERLTDKQIRLRPSKTFQLVKLRNGGLFSGLSNRDFYWARNADAAYKQFMQNLYGRRYDYKGESMLSGEILIKNTSFRLKPSGLVILPYAKGNIILSTIKWRKFLSVKADYAKRVISTLLHNLDVRINSNTSVVSYQPVEINKYANRDFRNRQNSQVKGWFGNGNDDMRYFPVNRTGIDPELNVPCPVESFPSDPVNYGGIDYKLINPDDNKGRACIVLNPPKSIKIGIDRKVNKIWILGALAKHLSTGTRSAKITFKYSDGSTGTAAIVAGIHLNGFQYLKEAEKGIAAWVGKTPKWKDAVLWSWAIDNPQPEKQIEHISITGLKPMAIIAITLEYNNLGK